MAVFLQPMDVMDAVTEPFILVNGKNRKGEAIEKASQLLKELGLGEGRRYRKPRIRSGFQEARDREYPSQEP